MSGMRHIGLFPTTVGISQIDIDFDSILASQDWEWTQPTDLAAEQSSQRSQSTMVLQAFPEVASAIIGEIHQFCEQVLQVDGRCLNMTTSWLTRAERGVGSARHHHTNSYLSAVWYPAQSSPIRFFAPAGLPRASDLSQINLGAPLEYNISNGSVYDVAPEKNMLVIFPSMLEHQILPNATLQTRYSLAVNTFPVGAFGQGDSAVVVPIAVPG